MSPCPAFMKTIYSSILNALFPSLGSGESFMMSGEDEGIIEIFSDTFTSGLAGGFADYNVRNLFPSAEFSGSSGNQIRVTIAAGSTENLSITSVYIGHKASSGNEYDFDGNQSQLLFYLLQI